jgi:hypothetical protein
LGLTAGQGAVQGWASNVSLSRARVGMLNKLYNNKDGLALEIAIAICSREDSRPAPSIEL